MRRRQRGAKGKRLRWRENKPAGSAEEVIRNTPWSLTVAKEKESFTEVTNEWRTKELKGSIPLTRP